MDAFRANWRFALGAGALALFAGYLLFSGQFSGSSEKIAAGLCRASYGNARSAIDTALIDSRREPSRIRLIPSGRGGFTCGDLRRRGRL
jgi:hypothetical protein